MGQQQKEDGIDCGSILLKNNLCCLKGALSPSQASRKFLLPNGKTWIALISVDARKKKKKKQAKEE